MGVLLGRQGPEGFQPFVPDPFLHEPQIGRVRIKYDFRKVLREIGRLVVSETQRRMSSGTTPSGGPVAPLAPSTIAQRQRRKKLRVRVAGERVAFAAGQLVPGVRTGELLKSMGKAGNVRVRKSGFVVYPRASNEIFLRWMFFNAGTVPRRARAAAELTKRRAIKSGGGGTVKQRLHRERQRRATIQSLVRQLATGLIGRSKRGLRRGGVSAAEVIAAGGVTGGAQPPRPIGGMTDQQVLDAADRIAAVGKEQMTEQMNKALAALRGRSA